MNHLKWMGHTSTIFDIQKNLRDDPDSCDVTLSAKGHAVRAHRFVLSSCSDLLRALLAEIPNGEETTIIIPDIPGALLQTLLAFIYLGETSLSSTNLSEFLEAINILGIKSAISFECNTATLASAAGTSMPLKAIGGIPIVQEELIEQDNNMVGQKIETHQNVMSDQQSSSRDLEFLDVYNEPQHKITYSIEHVPGSGASANEFILTENSGTFTLTQNDGKLENTTGSDCDKMDDTEDDVDADSHIIEEYSNGGDPIIEVEENVINGGTPMPSTTSTPIIQIKKMMQVGKIKVEVGDPLNTPTGSYAMLNNSRPFDSSLSAAVDAVILEGLSLQKAAHKYEISKTVLWRRVRQSPKYMKMPRENPVLSLAYERLKEGQPLKTISRDLEIPMSTLHRHKVRLAQQGRLPEYVTFKKRDSITRDPFADAIKGADDDVQDGLVHIRIQQRNGRKTLTTVQGLSAEYDLKKIVRSCKKEFACNGTVIDHSEYGEVLQLQGDQRENICQWLTKAGLAKPDQLKVHGF